MGEGHSNQILALSDKASIPLAETQQDLTPLQRHVITLTIKKQNEEAQKQQSSGGKRPVNSMRQPHGGGSGQTTTYVNENYE